MNIINLNIKNSYAHKNTTIKFAKGVNYILGKNESGKSEALDMIAYALFGTVALRGAASEYKALEVTLTFKVKDKIYIVDRAKKITLVETVIDKDGNVTANPVAVSTKAVNQAIIDLLGYNFDVYNKMNFSKQLEGNSFAAAGKSGRLELINKINGVDEANALESFLDKKRKGLKSEIKGLALTDNLKNMSFTPNKEYDKLGQDALQKLSETSVELFNSITNAEKIITAYSMIPSIDPELQKLAESLKYISYLHPIDQTTLSLKEYVDVITELKKESKRLQDQLLQESKYIEKYAMYSNTYGGFLEEHEITDAAAIHANNKIYAQKEALLKQGEITCPHCLEQFPLMAEALKAFEDVNYLYSDYTEAEVAKGKEYFALHEKNVRDYYKNAPILRNEIAKIELVVPGSLDITPQINSLDVLRRNEAQLKSYQDALNKFRSQFSEDFDLESLEATLELNRKTLNEISVQRTSIEAYQKEKAVYDSARDAQEKLETFVKERSQKIEAYESLIAESKRIKLEIQNNCIPTLNKKASTVINKMTGGEHFSLTLSDTFELLLDGKSITSYSGSAQVTANVAFRIALIEMFYKGTFPLFIGDEIDSFADATRASHIHDSLKTLADDGYQVILISHHALSFEGNIIDLSSLKK
jgi:DNA repair exonuclease SbcCD ATPase subunit